MVCKTKHPVPFLGNALPIVDPLDCKSVPERIASHLERNCMQVPVAGRLGVVPLEQLILHNTVYP